MAQNDKFQREVLPIPDISPVVLTTYDANAPKFHETQYFEMFGNRGLYHKGWVAVTLHKAPWDGQPRATFTTDEWELYDSSTDWTQCHNVAQKHPDLITHLQQLWLIEATKHNVLPLDDRIVERASDQLAGRPRLIQGNKQILYQGMERITEWTVLNMKNKSSSITAEIELPDGATAKGVIFAQGGNTGGYSLYAHEGQLKYCYNTMGLRKFFIESNTPIPSGKHQVRMEFKYDGGGLGKGGDVTLFLDGQAIGNGRIDLTVAIAFSADETADVGKETGSPVSPDYGPRNNEFNGVVNWVQLEAQLDGHDHLISPQERLNIAIAIH